MPVVPLELAATAVGLGARRAGTADDAAGVAADRYRLLLEDRAQPCSRCRPRGRGGEHRAGGVGQGRLDALQRRRADVGVAAAVVSGDVSAAVCAVRAISLACASFALVFWFRNDGIAIAARMPMIRMTTRSSIRVKPFSSWARRRSLESMDPPRIGDWVISPDPLVHSQSRLRQLSLDGNPTPSVFRGPWLCVPPSRVVCLWHRCSGTAGIGSYRHAPLVNRTSGLL